MDIKINDLIKYKTYMNPIGQWGKVIRVYETKDSINSKEIGKVFVGAESIEDGDTYSYVPIEDILKVYRNISNPIKDALEFKKSMDRINEIVDEEHRKLKEMEGHYEH